MKNLIALLAEQTQDLKASYMQQVEVWATEQIKINRERRDKYSRTRRTDYAKVKDYYTEQKFYYNTPQWKFTNEMIERSVKAAGEHYEDSIAKLAHRIMQKGLNEKNITVKNASVGVNIGATISDGNKTVNAFTIVASGMVQRPHYRFLVK